MNKAYSRKLRQLKFLSQEFSRLYVSEKGLSGAALKIMARIKRLVNELRSVISNLALKKALGSACLFLGLSYPPEVKAQNFLAPVQNTFGLVNTFYIAAPAFADLDNDGDLDLLVGEYYGTMKYFKNTGTPSAPSFTTPLSNPFGLSMVTDIALPAFVDLDGDGDKDLMVGEYYGNLKYFRNIGTASAPSFTTPLTNPYGLSATVDYAFPTFVDIDADGDMDLFAGEYGGNIQFFRNIGTALAPLFASPIQNPFGLTGVTDISAPAFVDMDGDGDQDMMIGEYSGNFNYFKNSGNSTTPSFTTVVQMNPFNLVATNTFALPTFVDLDNDGDKDLMVGEYDGNMQYFKNQNNVNVNVQHFDLTFKFEVYPNPTHDFIQILFEGEKDRIKSIEIIDMSGRICETYFELKDKISLQDLATGIYNIKITESDGSFLIRRIQKI